MSRLVIVVLLLLIGVVVYVQAENPPADITRAWYDERYDFMSYDDTQHHSHYSPFKNARIMPIKIVSGLEILKA